MRWQGERRSDNVEDRRGGGGMRMAGRPMTMGGGCLTLVVILIALYFGADLGQILQVVNQVNGPVVIEEGGGEPCETSPEDKEKYEFVRAVLASTEDAWTEIFAEQVGQPYQPPKLVVFSDAVRSGCGIADARVGPFYCPADSTVYIDLSFFQELDQKFGAPGDFAQAYVIAHEVGHHVQNLLGTSDKVHAAQQRARRRPRGQRAFGHARTASRFLRRRVGEPGRQDAQHHRRRGRRRSTDGGRAIGDDRIQEQAHGHVNPDSFTHGSSAQRVKWFRRGLQSGDMKQGDTFNAPSL